MFAFTVVAKIGRSDIYTERQRFAYQGGTSNPSQQLDVSQDPSHRYLLLLIRFVSYLQGVVLRVVS